MWTNQFIKLFPKSNDTRKERMARGRVVLTYYNLKLWNPEQLKNRVFWLNIPAHTELQWRLHILKELQYEQMKNKIHTT